MAAPQIAPLPPFFELSDGMVIRVTAVSATDNSTVSGVVVSGVSIDVDPIEPLIDADYVSAFPLLVPAES